MLDGAHLRTAALEASLTRSSSRSAGFRLGCYDLRAESADGVPCGVRLEVAELTGATSEAAHMHDLGHSLSHAWRTL